jgi:hypothetical protein
MEKKNFVLNVLLAVVLGAGLLVGMVWRAFQPNVVLADLELPVIAALILIALVIEYLFKGTQKRAWAVQILLAAITFAVIPFAAGYAGAGIRLILCGTAMFAALTFIFDSVAERVNVTCDCKCAMIPTAFVMYLACQCLMGMIL